MLDSRTLARWLNIFARKDIFAQPLSDGQNRAAKDTNVIFLGGEPTLNPSLPDAIREARRLGYGSVTVDTNGYLFHDILDKVTSVDVDYFSFSLDGATPKVNDPIRGEGVFKRCVSGIERAVKKGFGVSVIFTASRMNIHDLPNMVPLLTQLGVERFFIQVIGIRGKPAANGASSLQLNRAEWEEVVPRVGHEAARKGLHVTYPKVFLGDDEEFQCAGLVADNYFVFPNGRVYRCPLCEDFPFHSFEIEGDSVIKRPPINESDLFSLNIPEGCVLNKILHPGNIEYDGEGRPLNKIACCMLKEEVLPE